MSTPSRIAVAVAGLLLACSSGCVQHEEQNGGLFYTFTWSASLWLILAALLLLYFGVRWLFKKSWRWYFRALGIVGVSLSLLLAVVIVPPNFLDYLRLDDVHVEGRYGKWWSPTQYDVRFADMESMQFRVVRSEHYKGPGPSYWLDLTFRDGCRASLPMGDLMKAAVHEVRSRAAAAGVKVGELPATL